MDEAEMQVIESAMTLEEYAALSEKNAPLAANYIQLVEAYQGGKYDPAQDMITPAN